MYLATVNNAGARALAVSTKQMKQCHMHTQGVWGCQRGPHRRCSRSALKKRLFCRVFGEANVEEMEPIMPGEDFSFFLQKVPGAYVFLGHGDAVQHAH